MRKQDIDQLQNWLQNLVSSPKSLSHKITKAPDYYCFDEKKSVGNAEPVMFQEELSSYDSTYILKHLEYMSANFPVLKKLTGDDVFNNFVKAYLLYNTPDTIEFGNAFPDFLSQSKEIGLSNNSSNAFLDLLIDLAQIERARHESNDAETSEVQEILEIDAEDLMFQKKKVLTISSVRLLDLSFPMKYFYQALERGDDQELPNPRKTFMAINTKNKQTVIEELDRWHYIFLKECKEPIELHNAIAQTASICQLPASTLLADMYLWLPFFQTNGFIKLIED